MRYLGKLYRALNPVHARQPLNGRTSGRGAALHGGRFNPKGMAALYCSLSVTTAIASADDINLQLWQWGETAPSRLVLIDQEGRLGSQR